MPVAGRRPGWPLRSGHAKAADPLPAGQVRLPPFARNPGCRWPGWVLARSVLRVTGVPAGWLPASGAVRVGSAGPPPLPPKSVSVFRYHS